MIENTSHTIEVFCNCADIEHCTLERYISDVRILLAELDAIKATRGRPRKSP